MATRNIYTDTGVLQADDSVATPSSVATRDSNGDLIGRYVTGLRLISTGGVKLTSAAKTANYTATITDTVLIVDSTSGSVTITLPAASTSTGMVLTVKKIVSANSVILDGNASETIDSATTLTITTQWAAKTVYCDGSAWFVIASV